MELPPDVLEKLVFWAGFAAGLDASLQSYVIQHDLDCGFYIDIGNMNELLFGIKGQLSDVDQLAYYTAIEAEINRLRETFCEFQF